jgi:hypothetical protein
MDTAQYTQPLTVFNGSSLGQHVRHTVEFFQCLYWDLKMMLLTMMLEKEISKLKTI